MRHIFFAILALIPILVYAQTPNSVQFRNDCLPATARTDLAINNVRAGLLVGGDLWWNPEAGRGRYIVPKVGSGEPEVSAIFAGALWMGGIDPAGNLKIAAQTYGSSGRNVDYYPGPLDPIDGTTDKNTCEDWDRFFTVYSDEIEKHQNNFFNSQKNNQPYLESEIPPSIRRWPARGNPFFKTIYGFDLPNTGQGLAPFYDWNNNGFYEPHKGDYPSQNFRGCHKPNIPDQMTFWIFNDYGNVHGESGGDPIQMEVQATAFAYNSDIRLNDHTFYHYKFINRAIESIDSTYIGLWTDVNLGCEDDDYFGCDTTRNMAYYYNADELDGFSNCECGATNTYCEDIPIIGIDFLRGPLDEFGLELGMSSFTYYTVLNFGISPMPQQSSPRSAAEYYNYLTGRWRNNEPFTYGGSGYQTGEATNFVFPDPPNDSNGWSMCADPENPMFGLIKQSVQSTGPFRMDPGAVNELIFGVLYSPNADYPCPSIRALQSVDDYAQLQFENCFISPSPGPDAPDMDIIELDKELVLILSNDTITSNNAYESYAEGSIDIPQLTQGDKLYRFEGYKIFQLAHSGVTISDFDNPDLARLIFITDKKNEIEKIYNWEIIESNIENNISYHPILMNEGVQNEGIQHTFRVMEDQFATGDRRLVNHKKYYFTAVAYAYNNYEEFDPFITLGQQRSYFEGRKNIGENGKPYYTAIPRPIVNQNLSSFFGDAPVVTRLDGLGMGGNFTEISAATEQSILDNSFNGEIIYQEGSAPIKVEIYNPLVVKNGEYILTFTDDNLENDQLDSPTKWQLIDVNNPNSIFKSKISINNQYEHLFPDLGFSINIEQTLETGDTLNPNNGAIGQRGQYPNGGQPWFTTITDDQTLPNFLALIDGALNFVATEFGGEDHDLDPAEKLTRMDAGQWIPYYLANYRLPNPPSRPFISPALRESGHIVRSNSSLQQLNNVDIVFTSDKSKWSRCVVAEMWTTDYNNATLLRAEGNREHFDLRARPSVSKEDIDGDGLPDPDGELDENGEPLEGMGWFPGYAIDVETGQRLNIFFGENSLFRQELAEQLIDGFTAPPTGADMMWNPTEQTYISPGATNGTSLLNLLLGGQHFIYVTNQSYDECAFIRSRLAPAPSPVRKVLAMKDVTWTCMPMLLPNMEMLSYDEGLIPSEYRVQLRVDNPYQVEISEDYEEDTRTGTSEYNYYPTYRIAFKEKAPVALNEMEFSDALNHIQIVPNPYYAYSAYETESQPDLVKITNLPAQCTVTIYSLDGQFVRQFQRNESHIPTEGFNRGTPFKQYVPDIEWDLKNFDGGTIGSGVFLIHVDAGEQGERILKWFGVVGN